MGRPIRLRHVDDEPDVPGTAVALLERETDVVLVETASSSSGRSGTERGFYVEDDGRGIPVVRRGSVFDPGFSTATDGTCFGPSIVRSIAEEHGWTVRVIEGVDGSARVEFDGVEFADA